MFIFDLIFEILSEILPMPAFLLLTFVLVAGLGIWYFGFMT